MYIGSLNVHITVILEERRMCENVFLQSVNLFQPRQISPEVSKNQTVAKMAFLHIRSKGSYTLEMAVVLPLVTAFDGFHTVFFRVLQVQTQVQEALVYASRQTAAQASIGEFVCGTFWRLLKCNSVKNCSSIKNIDIMYQRVLVEYPLLFDQIFEGPEITLRADYYIKLPITIFSK